MDKKSYPNQSIGEVSSLVNNMASYWNMRIRCAPPNKSEIIFAALTILNEEPGR